MNQDLYKNITVIVGGFLVISWIFDWEILTQIATVIAVACALVTPIARGVNWLWLKLAFVLGWFNSRVLLSVIYFVFLFPIALFSRLFKKDALVLKRQDKLDSYYSPRDHKYLKEDLENIW